MLVLWIFTALFVLIHWLYKVNKDYYILAFFARRVHTRNGEPIESIVPVPKGRTIFGNCFDFFGKNSAEVFEHMRQVGKKAGGSYLQYRLGRVSYNVIDAQNAEYILNHPNLTSKGFVYTFLQPFLRTGVLTSKDPKWHTRRNMLTRTFHMNILSQFQEVFIAESLKFVRHLEGLESNVISLSDPIARYTLNSICETAMGVKLDEMAETGDRYRENFSLIDECFVRRVTNPFYWGDFWFNLLVSRKFNTALRAVHDFSSDIIAKRRILLEEELDFRRATQAADDDLCMPRGKPFAMLDTLICAEKDGLIDHSGICEEVDTLMFEGYDSPNIALTFALMNMSFYQEHQELCYQEIQSHIQDNLSNLDLAQLNKLKHLENFLKETMRLYPSIPLVGRETWQETELSNGLIMPIRSQINIHIFDLHRNPKHWEEPDLFRPERFLPENSENRPKYAFIPFSAGQRNCLGKKYAMQQMKTLMVVILKKFRILQAIDPQSIVFQTGINLRTKNKIQVKFVRR